MKKIIIALVFLAVVSPIFAQEGGTLHYLNFFIERIYPTNRGYIVVYRGQRQNHAIGIPSEWFGGPEGRAQKIRLYRGASWPTMSVFFRDGEFSHVRLNVHPARGHLSWGHTSHGMDVSRFFQDTDSFDIQF
ncbi:MAG: hypothetical protein FWC97_11890 [Treponema sp.]|nr:hypothetical protein [Treponema sp.]